MKKIGRTTVDIIVRYSIDHTSFEESIDEVMVVTNDVYATTPTMTIGIVEAVKTIMMTEGIDIYSKEDVLKNEENNCGN